MIEFWKSLTEPQAHLLIGIVQWIVVPVFGYLWAKATIKQSTKQAEAKAEQAEAKAEQANTDLAEAQEVGKQEVAAEVDDPSPNEPASERWKQLKAQWECVRNRLFKIAFDPKKVDGRTRAAYQRIDLRGEGYARFISRVGEDGWLGDRKETFERALALWNQYRTNRREVPPEAIKQMKDYCDSL